MAECNSRTAKKILRHLIKYQKLEQEEDNNYQNKIKRELGLSSKAVSDGLNVLIDLGIISNRKQIGRKTIIYVHPGVLENAEIHREDQEEERPSLARALN